MTLLLYGKNCISLSAALTGHINNKSLLKTYIDADTSWQAFTSMKISREKQRKRKMGWITSMSPTPSSKCVKKLREVAVPPTYATYGIYYYLVHLRTLVEIIMSICCVHYIPATISPKAMCYTMDVCYARNKQNCCNLQKH